MIYYNFILFFTGKFCFWCNFFWNFYYFYIDYLSNQLLLFNYYKFWLTDFIFLTFLWCFEIKIRIFSENIIFLWFVENNKIMLTFFKDFEVLFLVMLEVMPNILFIIFSMSTYQIWVYWCTSIIYLSFYNLFKIRSFVLFCMSD